MEGRAEEVKGWIDLRVTWYMAVMETKFTESQTATHPVPSIVLSVVVPCEEEEQELCVWDCIEGNKDQFSVSHRGRFVMIQREDVMDGFVAQQWIIY